MNIICQSLYYQYILDKFHLFKSPKTFRVISWNSHINNIYAKANRTISFLRRNIHSCPKEVKRNAYTTLVRPSVELVRDSSVVRRHYILLLEPSDIRAQYIRKTADLPHHLWVGTFPRFVAIGFY